MAETKDPIRTRQSIRDKALLRVVIGLAAIAVLWFGWTQLREFLTDPDIGEIDTAGWIAAVERQDRGTRAVLFDADGNKIVVPEWTEGTRDVDIAWRPDGGRLIFSSDRERDQGRSFGIYRWNPATETVEARSTGSRSQGRPSFMPAEAEGANDLALITSGGRVLELNLRTGDLMQILPPVPSAIATDAGEGGGAVGQFDQLYERFGQSFEEAYWGPNREWILARMRRDQGDVLVLQGLGGAVAGLAPIPLVAGRDIEYDVHPDGLVAVSIREFQFVDPNLAPPEFVVDGVAIPPFKHTLYAMDMAELTEERVGELLAGVNRIVAFVSPDDSIAAIDPKVAPDGQRFAAVLGSIENEVDFIGRRLALFQAGSDPVSLVDGQILEPSWSPDMRSLTYLKFDGGESAIYTIDVDGTDERKLTDSGNYASPIFSPARAE